MANDVLNFSWQPGQPIPLHPDLKVGIIPSTLSAVDAAEIAESNAFDILLVTQDGAPAGAFFRDYLKEILPTHGRVAGAGVSVPTGSGLPDMIRLIDQAGIDFHSELVNTVPSLWKCSSGHVTSANPCPRHQTPTTPY